MTESDLLSTLAASGPVGAAVVFLGVVIRSWVTRLELQLDRLGDRLAQLTREIAKGELETRTALTALEHRVAALENEAGP